MADAVAMGTAFTRSILPVNPGLAELLAESQLATLISWMLPTYSYISLNEEYYHYEKGKRGPLWEGKRVRS